jgi:hypothetical protein
VNLLQIYDEHKTTMTDIGLLAVTVIIVLVLYGIGRVLRNKSRRLKVVVLAPLALVVFLSLALICNAIGIGIYAFYEIHPCQDTTPTCVSARQQEQTFYSEVPKLTLLMTVPKALRPACETISPEFCNMQKGNGEDFASVNYILGAFGTLIALFIVLLGLRQKRVKEVRLDNPLST